MPRAKQIVKPGDVLAIPLPDGRFAFGRMFKEGDMWVYAKFGSSIDEVPVGFRLFVFQTGIYKDVVSSGIWPKVAKDPFENPEHDWPVPQYGGQLWEKFIDIYDHGYPVRKALPTEVVGWEVVGASDVHHIVDRILAASQNIRSKWELNAPWQVDFLDLTDPGNPKRVAPRKFD